MAFSPWTLLGQSLGSGFNQGFQDQLEFHNTLNKANRLSNLDEPQQSLALALMGSGQKGGNDLNTVLAQLLLEYAKKNGLLGMAPTSQIRENPNPQSGVANLIRQDEAKGFGVYELNGEGYKPITKEQVDELLRQGAKRVQ